MNIDNNENQDKSHGIGTLNEKNIHAYLKDYYENDKNYQEIKVGKYIADIKRDNNIIEIQTSNLKSLIGKIDYYLSIGLNIKIVHPIIGIKHLIWLDNNNQELSKRTTRTNEVIQDTFYEVRSLASYIKNKQISIEIVYLECNDIRHTDTNNNKVRKSQSRREVIPLKILNTIVINSENDLIEFIPLQLRDTTFSSKEFKKESHVHDKYYNNILKTLRELNIINIVEKQGNKFIYKVNKSIGEVKNER